MEGQGKVDFPVTTAKPEAQAFINQGVAQLHSFYYFEAERSFRQAAQIDPDCPMAYWGMAMANVNNAKRARGSSRRPRRRPRRRSSSRASSSTSTPSTPSTRTAADDKAQQSSSLGLETIVQEFPDDLDARAWLAMVTWQNGERRRQPAGGRHRCSSPSSRSSRCIPARITTASTSGTASSRSAPRSRPALYAKTAPGIAHAWHMPGHTYTGLKRYADAAYQQEGSARVDHAYMIRDRVMPFEIHNYAHNNQWLATSLSHIGRARDAIAVAREPRRAAPRPAEERQERRRLAPAERPAPLVRGPRPLRALGRPDRRHRLGRARLVRHAPGEARGAYTLGLAYAAKGDEAKLAEQIAAIKAGRPQDRRRRPAPSSRRSDPAEPATAPPAPVPPAAARRRPPSWPSSKATRSS